MRILAILLIVLSFACKNKKEATAKEEVVQERTYPVKEDVEEQVEAKVVKKTIDFPDNAIARIQRTPCFGRCPIYTITVYNDGTVIYNAEKFVEYEGKFKAQADEQKIQMLMSKAEEIGFFKLQSNYDNENVTDLPSTITTLRRDDEVKQIINRYEGPEELSLFEKYFDELFLKMKWSEMQ
ncbi:MAG: hypothetical protein CMP59_04110 [Flavobacteriales bacterium]|nr:hypothetical protein [Flavobacteriales bacterium]